MLVLAHGRSVLKDTAIVQVSIIVCPFYDRATRGKRMTTKVIHEPQLDTILMVEKAIREAQSYPTKKRLLQSLPRQVQYQTFNRILDYLESSNKIVYDKQKIIWVFPDNPKLKKLIETSVQLR